MKAKVSWGAAGLMLGLVAALAIPSFAQQSPPPSSGSSTRTVTVSGSATITSSPDEAVITLGVQTQAPTAQGALQQNASRMSAVMKAILGDKATIGDRRREGIAADLRHHKTLHRLVDLVTREGDEEEAPTEAAEATQTAETAEEAAPVGTAEDKSE